MKNRILTVAIAMLGIALLMGACKRKEDESTTPITKDQLDPQVQQHNADAGSYKAELDEADNDINNFVSKTSLGYGGGGSSALCGATIDSSQIGQKILTFNFDGTTPCFSPSRTRSGKIKVQLTTGNRWGDVGSVLTLTFMDYRITRLKDNKSIMFNGVKTYRNVNGNDWLAFFMGTAKMKYQERALNIAVTLDNNQSAVWNSARVTEWSYVKGNSSIPYDHIVFTCNGDTAVNGYSNVDSWGTNRYKYAFTTYYNTPILSNTYCGLWRFNAGELVHKVNNNSFTFTLGTDQNGNPTPYTCAYGFKVEWSGTNRKAQVILSY